MCVPECYAWVEIATAILGRTYHGGEAGMEFEHSSPLIKF